MLPDYKNGLLFTALKKRHLHVILIQATIAGGSGAPTVDTAASDPNTTVARNSAGQYTITFPKGQVFHPLDACTVLAEQAGSQGYWESFSATGGTATIEFGTTPGTAAELADNTRICFAFLLGKI
jgi:hypothetical protein